ncbi:phage antirepressor [Pseudoramibacter alactolyticus]|mgnify:CR=1 FL=1|uniref:phage antirepressor n=1 Tax=Pseudoramibacter alactolyticus TaxID=113287 RepID=UPI00248F2DC4|nr:phage antirepressor KilAC domain-containing protein [Pseudoramibacter alactolyticus]
MNEMKIFENEEFGQLRTIEMDGEPWFMGKDVAEALGYSNTRDALSKHVDNDDKNTVAIHDGNTRGNPNQTIINESGVYSLVFGSKLKSAKRFKHWVTSEVLPSIRKNGAYMTDAKAYDVLNNPSSLISLLEQAAEQLKNKDIQIESMKPKAIFADAVSASDRSILIGEMAKILRQNGVKNMGQNRLFEWMRDNGFLIKGNRSDRNMPTQRAMEMGLFEIKETTIVHSDGHTTINKTPKVTGKGQAYFVNRFLDRVETYG